MEKINFEAGTQVSPAKVTIDNVDHEVIPAVWEGNTPLSPFVLNKMQDNIEEETKTTQTTEVSEDLTITDCAPVGAKLDIVSGKTIQEEGEPSPDNIIPIRNVGDNINLINIYDINTEGYSYTNNGITFTFLKNGAIKLNGTATADTSIPLIGAYKSGNYKLNLDEKYTQSGLVSGVSLIFYNLTTQIARFYNNETKEVKGQIDYVILAVDNGRSLDNVIIYPKLEPGTIPTPYTPYNCGSADFKVENKNLAKNTLNKGYSTTVNGITYTIIENGAIKVNGTSTAMSELRINTNFNIKKGDYVISGGANNVMFQLIETGVYSKECYADEANFTLNEDKTSQILRLRIASGETVNTTVYPMIRKKGTSNNYVEHQEQIKSFPFTEGQRLHIGDYLASNGTHHKRKTYVFTGEEDFDMGTTDGLNFFVNKTATSDFKYIDDNTCNYICNSFVAIKVSERWQNNTIYISSGKQITITSNNFTSVAELQSFLAEQYANGTPVIIEYELAEEEIIPYTAEQKEAYYQLQHLLMYEGYTNITCIDEIKPDIQATYWYNNELNKSYGERFDKVEDSIEKYIETITNEKGTAIKFADGTMICIGGASSGSYDSNTKTYIADWIFPVAFKNPPIVNGNTLAGNAKIYTNAFQSYGSHVVVHTKCLGTSGAIETCDRSASCIAIGRWK